MKPGIQETDFCIPGFLIDTLRRRSRLVYFHNAFAENIHPWFDIQVRPLVSDHEALLAPR
jgi:hypothetical protein